MLAKLKYLFDIVIFSISNKAIWIFLVEYIKIELKSRKDMYTIKVLIFLSNTTLANFFLSINSIYLIVDKALAKKQNFYINSFFIN